MTSIFAKVEDEVVADAETAWTDAKEIFVDDVEPQVKNALLLVERNGGALLFQEATALVSAIGTQSWSTLAATLLTNAKAAGATTLASEEQLAASTALQIAQAAQAAVPTVAPTAPTTDSSATGS